LLAQASDISNPLDSVTKLVSRLRLHDLRYDTDVSSGVETRAALLPVLPIAEKAGDRVESLPHSPMSAKSLAT